jgi:hypothetical protein
MNTGPVVFLVMSHHGTNLVERLVRKLIDTDGALSVVHHDAKATELPQLPRNDRVMLIPDPLAVQWGRTSLVEATLHAMGWVADHIRDFSWIVLISGQDYPARSTREIEAELLTTEADAFVHWEAIPPVASRRSTYWQRIASRRYWWHTMPGTSRTLPVPRLRSLWDGVALFAGSTWWNLSRRVVDQIQDMPNLRNYLIKHRLRSCGHPDESFFQTMVLNSSLGLHIVNSDRRFIHFTAQRGGAHPEILTVAHLDAIRESNAFFVRKVDEHVSGELLNVLDQGGHR